MIHSFKAVNLNGKMTFDLDFHEDINIITGKNGSGKTTLLKLLWYATSGNLERIVPEIAFDSFELVADSFMVAMTVDRHRSKRGMLKLNYRVGSGELKGAEQPLERVARWGEVEEANRLIARSGTSIFFPTFRRIEGGFPISGPKQNASRLMGGSSIPRDHEIVYAHEAEVLQQAINRLSDRLSVGAHRFVAPISTEDIVGLLTSKYAEISERTNRLHMELSRFIVGRVKATPVAVGGRDGSGSEAGDEGETREALEEIQRRAGDINARSEALLQPFTVLSQLVAQVFQYRGIKLTDPITLGDAAGAIASEVLSAGERQMLGFLCYNAFASKSCLFIDEPEISLHVDWQRILFPLLLKQSTGNQFIVATHSPFIYSKYADKELVLAADRGDEDADAEDDGG